MSKPTQITIAHLTSAHSDTDIRIFHKECQSLKKAGYNVIEITLKGQSRIENGVEIRSANYEPKSRFDRMRKASKQIYELALKSNADLFHFHDPELLSVGLKLKKAGKKVIYDAHEDTPRQILSKPYLNRPLRKLISWGYEKYENYIAKRLDAIVVATPFIANRYKKINANTVTICNFPLFDEIDFEEENEPNSRSGLCYIGGISMIRGLKEMIQVAGAADVELKLAGKWDDTLNPHVHQLKGWKKVKRLGFLNRKELGDLKKSSVAGLVILLPEPNHVNSYPIKMFEYMAAGLPVIASNFPLWREILESTKAGFCTDPYDIDKITEQVNYLIEHPDVAKKMGETGRQLVIDKYNWNKEEKKLIQLYSEILQ